MVALLSDYAPIVMLIGALFLGRVALLRLGVRVPRVALWSETLLFLAAYLIYFLVRGLVKDRVALAKEHASWIIQTERKLGIFLEFTLQQHALALGWPITLANWAYVWLYWPVLAATLVWLFMRHRADYALFRNGVLLSGALGLLIFASFPVAPPRFVEGLGFADTVGTHSRSYQLLFPGSLANLYAAMPSLHEGWSLLMGIAIATHATTRRWRAFGTALPIIMFVTIVVTANHYILDALAGAVVAMTGLGLARLLQRAKDPRQAPAATAVSQHAPRQTLPVLGPLMPVAVAGGSSERPQARPFGDRLRASARSPAARFT